MDTLSLIALLLETLSSAVPSLTSGQSALAPLLDTVLSTAAALIRAGDAGSAELQALTAHVKQMVSAGTDPTEDDWNQLRVRSDAAHALIQSGSSVPGETATKTSPPNGSSST